MYTIKHREIENLRFKDFNELRNSKRQSGFKEKCDIVEKHIGMTLAINEKKKAMMDANDRVRSKMAKDSFRHKADQAGAKTPYHRVLREQVSVAAYAPDIVKWTQKDMKKIMAMGGN